ncbi:hypothetical protein FD755_020733 [Muntiacus reevesi]|uniref:G-protein coupled receptors family 1 profile domain-containing protein n=1 Tax=Muntiacus reevesi TaxID=9886 RepID=A0A5N3WZR1_MUNRE|nr:hypothetical protein FD755_020733 [Muntiacus reevesi]
MAGNNFMEVMFFILHGFAHHPKLQVSLFMMFLFICLFTVWRNLGLILLIRIDSQLHTPMYFFLINLVFIDIFYPLLKTSPSLTALFKCTFFVGLVCSECFLLGSMACDHYVAICNPLLYSVVMSQEVCRWLGAIPYMISFTTSLVSICVISTLAFCDASINHFFCNTTALLALSCMDAFNTEMVIFVLAGFTLLRSLFIITVTYIAIISAILQIRSAAGRQKAFSTSVSHIMGVTPDNTSSLTQAQVASVIYTIVIPVLNLLIYILSNKDVKNALLKAFEKLFP